MLGKYDLLYRIHHPGALMSTSLAMGASLTFDVPSPLHTHEYIRKTWRLLSTYIKLFEMSTDLRCYLLNIVLFLRCAYTPLSTSLGVRQAAAYLDQSYLQRPNQPMTLSQRFQIRHARQSPIGGTLHAQPLHTSCIAIIRCLALYGMQVRALQVVPVAT